MRRGNRPGFGGRCGSDRSASADALNNSAQRVKEPLSQECARATWDACSRVLSGGRTMQGAHQDGAARDAGRPPQSKPCLGSWLFNSPVKGESRVTRRPSGREIPQQGSFRFRSAGGSRVTCGKRLAHSKGSPGRRSEEWGAPPPGGIAPDGARCPSLPSCHPLLVLLSIIGRRIYCGSIPSAYCENE